MKAELNKPFGLEPADAHLLVRLRSARAEQRKDRRPAPQLTLGQRVADRVAAVLGSWRFIFLQSVVLAAWVAINSLDGGGQWDPYPFILLNLVLSFQAAYAAPMIMMSQNRQQEVDRQQALNDYRINVKAELEIELLHQKIDELREKEVLALTNAIERLTRQLEERGVAPR